MFDTGRAKRIDRTKTYWRRLFTEGKVNYLGTDLVMTNTVLCTYLAFQFFRFFLGPKRSALTYTALLQTSIVGTTR